MSQLNESMRAALMGNSRNQDDSVNQGVWSQINQNKPKSEELQAERRSDDFAVAILWPTKPRTVV